jgi:hypothetical protein
VRAARLSCVCVCVCVFVCVRASERKSVIVSGLTASLSARERTFEMRERARECAFKSVSERE